MHSLSAGLRTPAGLCALTIAVLALTACANPGMPAQYQDAPNTSAAPAAFAAEVSGVTPGPGAKTVTVHVEAPTGYDGCPGNARVDAQTEESGVIFANIVRDLTPSPAAGTCPPPAPSDVRLTSNKPIGSRPLTLNQKQWALKNGTYTRCAENLGCYPPKDHCDPAWTRAAVLGLDVSRHSQGDIETCNATWLIMTVPDDPTACGAEARPGCEVNTAVRRYFLQIKPTGWQVVTQTTTGGCDAVLKAAPTFPQKLCVGLKPTTRFVTSAPALPSGAPPGG